MIQFHHNFLLGPANEVLAGGAVLVDTASQYGVAPLYLIGGWFQLAPIGYGTLGLLDGAVTALAFAAAYAVLRICGCDRPLAAGAIAIGVVALAYNLSYPVGGLPEQGQLRFGLPMALIAFTVAGLRWPRRVRLAGCGALAIDRPHVDLVAGGLRRHCCHRDRDRRRARLVVAGGLTPGLDRSRHGPGRDLLSRRAPDPRRCDAGRSRRAA